MSQVKKKNSISFALSPTIRAGKGFEYVFVGKSDTLSRLEWQLLPAFGFSASADINVLSQLHASINSSFFLPLKVGKMYDLDFENERNRNILTKFSEHENYLKQSFNFYASLGWTMPLVEYMLKGKKYKIMIEPTIGLYYYTTTWTARNGYAKYSTSKKSIYIYADEHHTFNGEVAQYTQKFLLPNIGLLFKYKLPKYWTITTSIQLCPQVIALCKDTHSVSQVDYYDIFRKKGFSLHFDLYTEKKFANNFGLFFSSNSSMILSYSGYTIAIDYKKKKVNKSVIGTSGTALYAFDFNFGIIIYISTKR